MSAPVRKGRRGWTVRPSQMAIATCPKSLREVRYKCFACDGVSVYRFARGYVPFRDWFARCLCCGRHELLRALGRVITGGFR